jgi:quercetin dioxygenase-like cupin family protein
MALQRLQHGKKISLLPLGMAIENTPTTALFRDKFLEVLRLNLLCGKHIPLHSVAGSITLHCIEGSVEIDLHDSSIIMNKGDLLYLESHSKHAVTALTNASLLVTIALIN